MKIMIVGANYNNKGAQSMLFVAVSEIRKSFPDSKIYFATHENIDESDLTFKRAYYTYQSRRIALKDGMQSVFYLIYDSVKRCVKRVLHGYKSRGSLLELKHLMPSLDVIIDVSGFALGDKFSVENQRGYLDNIKLAKKYGVPIYLMPQSFGPFEKTSRNGELCKEIKDVLQYPRIIFAREKEGYEILTHDFGLNNVVLSTDLVLQNSGVKMDEIFRSAPEMHLPDIDADKSGNVAIIPNRKCLKNCDKKEILNLYKKIIERLLEDGRKIYIFRHSGEDLDVCKDIKGMFLDCREVILLENDFSCFEYDAIVKNFDFIICSRFHGIVHAYRNYVPCIALGWAVKYQELAHNVGQDRFVFDVSASNFDIDKIIAALNDLLHDTERESAVIKNKMAEIQKHNCFNLVIEDIRSISKTQKK